MKDIPLHHFDFLPHSGSAANALHSIEIRTGGRGPEGRAERKKSMQTGRLAGYSE